MNVNDFIYTISDKLIAEIHEIINCGFELPLQGEKVTHEVRQNILSRLSSPLIKELSDSVIPRLLDKKHGFVVIKCHNHNSIKTDDILLTPSIICAILGIQYKVIQTKQLWNRLGVDLIKKDHESEGIGYNCIHIDIPNTTDIPEITCLYCSRPDPNKGGETILSNTNNLFDELNEKEIEECLLEEFYEGRHYNLINVGKEYSPFPIIKINKIGEIEFRFSGKMKFDDRNKHKVNLLLNIENILLKNSIYFLLEKQDLLLINQKIIVHGRKPLKGNQKKILPEQRREIYQTKLKLSNIQMP